MFDNIPDVESEASLLLPTFTFKCQMFWRPKCILRTAHSIFSPGQCTGGHYSTNFWPGPSAAQVVLQANIGFGTVLILWGYPTSISRFGLLSLSVCPSGRPSGCHPSSLHLSGLREAFFRGTPPLFSAAMIFLHHSSTSSCAVIFDYNLNPATFSSS
jgi:hypothetical protein